MIAQILDDRKRIKLSHACGFPLLAYPVKSAGQVCAGFAALRDTAGIELGQTVDHCPQCRADLRMSWSELQEALGHSFKP